METRAVQALVAAHTGQRQPEMGTLHHEVRRAQDALDQSSAWGEISTSWGTIATVVSTRYARSAPLVAIWRVCSRWRSLVWV